MRSVRVRVLITTTSYQDTPGLHHALLEEAGYELVRARGPLPENEIMELVGDVDGIICGDDEYTRAVLEKSLPRLKVLSKYGIGLDRIDLKSATDLGIPVCFTPGVNHTTVAEHTFGLMISLSRNITTENEYVKSGQWKRITGHELMGKTIGILGLGRTGKEVAIRAIAFGMKVVAYDIHFDGDFLREHPVEKADSIGQVVKEADILSLHMNLSEDNKGCINTESIDTMKKGIYIVNCARGALIVQDDLAQALKSGKIAGYACDVLEHEPPEENNPLIGLENVIVTPHIGSRTYESVARQAEAATRNLILVLDGKKPLAQAN